MPMFVKHYLLGAAVLLLVACSNDTGADDVGGGDDALIVPEGLTVVPLPGGNGVLEVIAFTLQEGENGAEVYVALKNVGDTPACAAGVAIELYDASDTSLAGGIRALLSQHFYRLRDEPDTIAACIGPGDVSMAAFRLEDWPSDVGIEAISYVVYRCTYFALDVVPIDGISINDVKTVTRSAGTAYTGTFVNGLDVEVENPWVTVFPLNRVGRPLGELTGSGTVLVPPGGSWVFETDALDTTAVGHAAYAAGKLVN